MSKKTYPAKSDEVLIKFIAFCKKNPRLRFWQALINFMGKQILVDGQDPFYWEGKRG